MMKPDVSGDSFKPNVKLPRKAHRARGLELADLVGDGRMSSA